MAAAPLGAVVVALSLVATVRFAVLRAHLRAREVSERALEQAKAAADQANRAKSDFLAVMSHEIRTPLNAVMGFATLLSETRLDEAQRGYLGTITSEGARLSALINDILDFTKIEQGRLALERMEAPFDASALRRAASLAEGSVLRALTYVDPETLALVEAVRARLDALPHIDTTALLALAEDVAGKAGERDFAVMIETVQCWISDHLHAHAAAQPARLAPLAEVWEKLGQQAREVETYNLDRRPLVMTMFHDLSAAVSRSRAA